MQTPQMYFLKGDGLTDLNSLPIASTQMLSQKLKGWTGSNRCRNLLHGQLPGFSEETVLLKTVAVNTLYGTNVYAVKPVAQHACRVLQEADGSLMWWTFAGAGGNATIASELARLLQGQVDHDCFKLKFDTHLTVSQLTTAIEHLREIPAKQMRPTIDDEAITALKVFRVYPLRPVSEDAGQSPLR